MLERRAMEAERETIDRYVAAFLADRVGQIVQCRITGVQSFGFFATVEGLGGDGLLFARDLGREYFRFDEAARQLVGEESGDTYRIGQRLELAPRRRQSGHRLAALRIARGQLWRRRAAAPRPHSPAPAGGKRGRPANIRHQGKRR